MSIKYKYLKTPKEANLKQPVSILEIETDNKNNETIKKIIPLDPDNTDYAEIIRQVDAGELTIEPADE